MTGLRVLIMTPNYSAVPELRMLAGPWGEGEGAAAERGEGKTS